MAEEKKKSGGLRGMYGKKEGKEGSKKEERTEPKAEAKKEGDLEKPKEGGGMDMHEKHHAEREARRQQVQPGGRLLGRRFPRPRHL